MAGAVINPEGIDEKYKVTRGELLELSRWAARGGPGEQAIRPPWLPGNVSYTEVKNKYKNVIDQVLNAIPGVDTTEIGLTTPNQLEALNSLRGFSSLPNIAETYTKGSFQKELEEWRLRSVKLPMSNEQRLEVERKISQVSNAVNRIPGDANAVVNFRNAFNVDEVNAYSTFRGLLEQSRKINPFEVAAQEIQQDIARDRARAAARNEQQAKRREEDKKKEEEAPPPPKPGQLENQQAELQQKAQEEESKREDGPSLEEQARRIARGEAPITPEEQAKLDGREQIGPSLEEQARRAERGEPTITVEEQADIDNAQQIDTSQTGPSLIDMAQTASEQQDTDQQQSNTNIEQPEGNFKINISSSDINSGETYEAKVSISGEAHGGLTYSIKNDPNSAADVSIDSNGNISSSDKITDGEIIYKVIVSDEDGHIQTADISAGVSFAPEVTLQDNKENELFAEQDAAIAAARARQKRTNESATTDKEQKKIKTITGKEVNKGVIKRGIRRAVKPVEDATTNRLAKRYRGAVDRKDEYSQNGVAGRLSLKALYRDMRKQTAIYQSNPVFRKRAEMLDEAFMTGSPILLLKMPKIPAQPGYINLFKKQLKEAIKDRSTLLLFAGADYAREKGKKAKKKTKDYIEDKTPKALKDKVGKTKAKIKRKVKKAKDKDGSVTSFLAKEFVSRVVLAPIKVAQQIVKTVQTSGKLLSRYNLVKRVLNSNTGQWVSSKFGTFKNTRIGAGLGKILKLDSVDDVRSGMSRVGGGITRVYRSGQQILTPYATSTGAIFRGGIGIGRAGMSYIKAVPTALLVGAGAAVAFGGAIGIAPAAALGGGTALLIKGSDNFLRLDPTKFARINYDPSATPTLMKPFVWSASKISNGAGSLLIRNGYGQFFVKDGPITRINYSAANTQQGQYRLLGTGKNIYSPLARGVRALNSGLSVGSVFAIGGLALGVNPLVAGAVGVGVGVGGKLALDAFKGSQIFKTIEMGRKIPLWARALSRIPANTFLGSALGNVWLGNQIGILKDRYNGNVVEFFKGEYIEGLGNLKGDPVGFMMAAGNWLGAAGYITSAKALAAFGASAATSAGYAIAGRLGISTVGAPISALPILAGTAVGTLVGLAAALLLGLPFTTAVVTGALIGGAIGGTLGGIAGGIATFFTSGAAAPTVFWFATAGASIGSTIGAWFGGTVEKAVNNVFKGYLGALNGLSSLMALFHLLKAGMNTDQLIPLAFAIVSLASILNKGGILQASNECLPADTGSSVGGGLGTNASCTGVNPLTAGNINEMYLGHYNVTLIGINEETWTQDNIKTVMRALSDIGAETISESTGGKQVYITLGEEGTFVEDNFVLIGFSNEAFTSPDTFSVVFKQELNYVAEFNTTTIEQAALIQ